MNKGKTTTMKRTLMIANIVALLGLASFSAYLFLENRDLNDQVTLTNEQKNERLVDEVNQVYDLPDEKPVVGVVKDVEEFKVEFPAFANDDVQLEDSLLFFRKARLNVLYRPSEKRVVKTYNVQVPIAVELIGSQEAIDETEADLAQFGNNITVTKKVDNNINQAFVFDVDGDQTADVKQIADGLGLEVGSTLPTSVTPDSVTEVVIAVTASAAPEPAEDPADGS